MLVRLLTLTTALAHDRPRPLHPDLRRGRADAPGRRTSSLGRLVRPDKPSPEKGEVYECGEQPIGTAWVQFDLRFYVVALLFVIFDVEMAFFFPWAVVFGSANRAADEIAAGRGAGRGREDAAAARRAAGAATERRRTPAAAKTLAWLAFADILVFFGVLLVGFAYLWRRGDLEWVRSMAGQSEPSRTAKPTPSQRPVARSRSIVRWDCWKAGWKTGSWSPTLETGDQLGPRVDRCGR